MSRADVVVIGAGLGGLTAAIGLAEAGATVEVVARGHAATHWTAGGIDVAAPDGAATTSDGIHRLSANPGHPYALLADDAPEALADVRAKLAGHALDYVGGLDDELRTVPTSIGGTRRAGILPAGQAGALAPWQPGERLVVCGIAGFKDFWPASIAGSLRRSAVWGHSGVPAGRPDRVDAIQVELPGLTGRRNLSGLELARRFDDATWRSEAFGIIARAVEPSGRRGTARVALPAVLGLDDHAAALDAAGRALTMPFFEIPLVSPSIPGLRLFHALRSTLRTLGGRLVIGEPVAGIAVDGRRVTSVSMAAATRQRVIRADAIVLATGGIAGGGLIGRADGRLVEPLLDLPVEAPPAGEWLADDPFDPRGHPLEAAGIRTDRSLRPVDAAGEVVLENVAVVGSLIAGQRYLVERCGDGVAIASGWRASAVLTRSRTTPAIEARTAASGVRA